MNIIIFLFIQIQLIEMQTMKIYIYVWESLSLLLNKILLQLIESLNYEMKSVESGSD